MRYRDSKGKFISKAEFQRREKISIALKKFHKGKKKNVSAKPSRNRNKNSSKSSSTSNSRIRNTPTKKNSKKSTTRKSTINSNNTGKFVVNRTKRRVKAYPDKRNKKTFFYAIKRKYDFKRKLHITNEGDFPRVRKTIFTTKENAKDFFSKYVTTSKKRKRLGSIGYEIRLRLKYKNKYIEVPEGGHVSYLPSFTITKKTNIDKMYDLMIEEIFRRFSEYLVRKDFIKLTLSAIEAEVSE